MSQTRKIIVGRFGRDYMIQRARRSPHFLFADMKSRWLCYDTGRSAAIAHFRLGPSEFKLFFLLATRAGYVVTWDQIIEHLWGDDSDGGPNDAKNSITIRVMKLRSKLSCLKFLSLKSAHGHGFQLDIVPDAPAVRPSPRFQIMEAHHVLSI